MLATGVQKLCRVDSDAMQPSASKVHVEIPSRLEGSRRPEGCIIECVEFRWEAGLTSDEVWIHFSTSGLVHHALITPELRCDVVTSDEHTNFSDTQVHITPHCMLHIHKMHLSRRQTGKRTQV